MPKTPPTPGTIIERRDVHSSLAIFKIRPDGGVPEFKAGQFLTMGIPDPIDNGKVVWRAYSIASPPQNRDHFELYIRLAERPVPGKLTTLLWKLGVGDEVSLRMPKGTFTVSDKLVNGGPDNRRLLMVAGGTGLAPFVSACLDLKARGCTRELVVCHGVSYINDLSYADLMDSLEKEAAENPDWNFKNLASVSRPDEAENAGWEGYTGRIETLFARGDSGLSPIEEAVGEKILPSNTMVHICGFDGTIKAVLAAFEHDDFRTRKAKREDGSYEVKFESYG